MIYKHQFLYNSTQNSLSCTVLKNLNNLDEFYRYLNFDKMENLVNFSKLYACSRPVWSNKECDRKKNSCFATALIGHALILDKLQYSNPLWSVNFDRDSIKLHKVLQYYNWTDNQVKAECLSPPVRQKSILRIVKFSKMANFSVESDSESGSSFKRPLKECEWYININFYIILLKPYSLLKF